MVVTVIGRASAVIRSAAETHQLGDVTTWRHRFRKSRDYCSSLAKLRNEFENGPRLWQRRQIHQEPHQNDVGLNAVQDQVARRYAQKKYFRVTAASSLNCNISRLLITVTLNFLTLELTNGNIFVCWGMSNTYLLAYVFIILLFIC